ncbi:MAG: UDP-glucose 4-epimerase [Promicromonosporaceae bacterium]|nr:UDP-glucose 4-epimerase [Promicromonosporaceae bacterium]
MTVLVTGGAGYIGAHVVRLLQRQGADVVVVDDLSTGTAERLGGAPLVRLDVAAAEAPGVLRATMEEHQVDAVIHFAARKQVGESVARPAWYYQQNIGGMANLLEAMEGAGVRRLVFSSSAAVYGQPDVPQVTEEMAGRPINPYGQTKLVGEWLGRAAAAAWGCEFVALRYFNVAGAGWPDLGDPACLNLVTMVLDRLERGEQPRLFGDDYPTPDGTCIRDYIHVLDLAEAHLAALDYLDRPAAEALNRPLVEAFETTGGQPSKAAARPDAFNVGTGTGSSVREVIDEIGRASGLDVTTRLEPRRPGDPALLVGDASLIGREFGWRARHGLPEIISSAWEAWQAGPRRIPV